MEGIAKMRTVLIFMMTSCAFFNFLDGMEKSSLCSLQDICIEKPLYNAIAALPLDIQSLIVSNYVEKKKVFPIKQECMVGSLPLSARFNKSLNTILIASCDESAYLFDISSGKQLKKFEHNGPVFSACFNKDETQILTASSEGAHIWDIKTGHEVNFFEHEGTTSSACFNKNETKVLIVPNSFSDTYAWDVAIGEQLDKAKSVDRNKLRRFDVTDTLFAGLLSNKSVTVFELYKNFSLDQALLCKLLDTWLLVEKPDKNIECSGDLFEKVASLLQINEIGLFVCWTSFPAPVRESIWKRVKCNIDKYGK